MAKKKKKNRKLTSLKPKPDIKACSPFFGSLLANFTGCTESENSKGSTTLAKAIS